MEAESTTNKLNGELNLNLDELKKIESNISRNELVNQELEILKYTNVPLEAFSAYKTLVYFTGYISEKSKVPFLKDGLSKITQKFQLFESASNKGIFIALFIDSKNKENANSLLQKSGFTPVNFANIENLRGSASANLQRVQEEMTKLEKKKNSINKSIQELGEKYMSFLTAADEFLTEQLEKAEAPLKFAATQTSFLIKGWVPTEDLSNSINSLNRVSKNKLFVHFAPAKRSDQVPVKLKNPMLAKPFEFFMDLYTTPSYREIDPTFFVFLTFPLLFGFMLGDFGYGIVTLMLFIVLRSYVPKARRFFNILIFASLATIFFGLLFGEFFGHEEIDGIHLPHILSRSHQIQELMYLAIAVGIIHINFGLIIGFINEYKSHGFMEAFYAKGGWIVLEIGVALIALSALNILTLPVFVGALFFILSLFMLYKGEGIKGLIELPTIFTNTLSYARLMAIGLSSVKLAEVINESAGEMFNSGGLLMIAGIFILIIGHIINIALGLLGSFLHSLRLHYVEFFSKFFHGGANRYSPFGAKQ